MRLFEAHVAAQAQGHETGLHDQAEQHYWKSRKEIA
jgi:hypothetical protein